MCAEGKGKGVQGRGGDGAELWEWKKKYYNILAVFSVSIHHQTVSVDH